MKQYMDDCGNIMSVQNVKVMSTNIYCRFIWAFRKCLCCFYVFDGNEHHLLAAFV